MEDHCWFVGTLINKELQLNIPVQFEQKTEDAEIVVSQQSQSLTHNIDITSHIFF
jgi:hypothetical protein